jgi:hypothetical protein
MPLAAAAVARVVMAAPAPVVAKVVIILLAVWGELAAVVAVVVRGRQVIRVRVAAA